MADLLRVKTQWAGASGGTQLSVHHFECLTASTANADAAKTKIKDFWTAMQSKIVLSATWTVLGEVGVIDPVTGDTISVITGTAFTGSGGDTGDPLPAQTQGEVTWRTSHFVGGRRVQGRTYIPLPTELMNVGGSPAPSYVTALQAAANNVMSTTDPILCVYSRTHQGFWQVDSALAHPSWYVLRRRR